SAETAARQVGGERVRVVDTRTVSAAVAMLALAVQRRLERGTSDAEVDALDYLARGGRLGRAAALAGSLLSVKPILTIEDGEVVPLRRVRGQQRALEEFRAIFAADAPDSATVHVGMAHAAAPERLRALEALVAATR